jgi:uncharacterized membrane protein
MQRIGQQETLMAMLVLGLVLFLGVHSSRVVADGWRTRMVARVGDKPWKAVYALLAVVGFVLIVYGYGAARQSPMVLWPQPPVAMRHIAALLTLLAFVLVVAAYLPGNQLKARLNHPMLLGVKLWALAHLLANNTLADLLLFGSFLAWAVVDFASARRRDRATGKVYAAGNGTRTAITVVVGLVAWAVFALWLHPLWIGVRPM